MNICVTTRSRSPLAVGYDGNLVEIIAMAAGVMSSCHVEREIRHLPQVDQQIDRAAGRQVELSPCRILCRSSTNSPSTVGDQLAAAVDGDHCSRYGNAFYSLDAALAGTGGLQAHQAGFQFAASILGNAACRLPWETAWPTC
jgi:hypothetical protein